MDSWQYEFQSLFSWNSLLNLIRGDTKPREIQFQSLFSWNSLLNIDTAQYRVPISQFQSLFSWNSLLNENHGCGVVCPLLVSILVFVELALELLWQAL